MTGRVLAVIIAFLLGSIPVGYLLVKFSTGEDIRESGSGNIGATNVLRTQGRGRGVITLVLDILKGLLAVFIADKLTGGSDLWMSAAAIAVMAGHAYPIFLRFHGGKAVASFIGAFLYLTPGPLLAALFVFVVVVSATRYISAGSIIAAGLFPFGVWMILHPDWSVLIAAFLAGGFIVIRHKTNVQRIRSGTENVFRWSRKTD
jgi:glycerol-3-phosphate acyltransferase PlsY